MFIIRFFFKLIFLCLLIVAGTSAYLYYQYKPLIDFAWKPEAYGALPGNYSSFGQGEKVFKTMEAKRDTPRTVDARNLSVRKENLNQVMGETKPSRQPVEYGVTGDEKAPTTGFFGFCQSKVSWARGKLNEASAKLNGAAPQDVQKQAKVAQAKALVPKARALLDSAEAWLSFFSAKVG